jgi:hypothetical protein
MAEILTETEVEEMDGWINTFRKLFAADAKKLLASHQALTRKVKELENVVGNLVDRPKGGGETDG